MAATPETKEDRVKTLNTVQEKRKQDCKAKVEAALEKMTAEGIKINGTLTIFTYQKGVKASPDADFTSKR